jgi:hypothetical protein
MDLPVSRLAQLHSTFAAMRAGHQIILTSVLEYRRVAVVHGHAEAERQPYDT